MLMIRNNMKFIWDTSVNTLICENINLKNDSLNLTVFKKLKDLPKPLKICIFFQNNNPQYYCKTKFSLITGRQPCGHDLTRTMLLFRSFYVKEICSPTYFCSMLTLKTHN